MIIPTFSRRKKNKCLLDGQIFVYIRCVELISKEIMGNKMREILYEFIERKKKKTATTNHKNLYNQPH